MADAEAAAGLTLAAGDMLRWTGGATNSRGAVVSPAAGLTDSLLGTALTWRASGRGARAADVNDPVAALASGAGDLWTGFVVTGALVAVAVLWAVGLVAAAFGVVEAAATVAAGEGVAGVAGDGVGVGLAVDRWVLATDRWALATDRWVLATDRWALAAGDLPGPAGAAAGAGVSGIGAAAANTGAASSGQACAAGVGVAVLR